MSYRGTIVGAGREVIKTAFGSFFIRAYADEPTSQTPPQDSGDKSGGENPTQSPMEPVINYEDLIAKARKEEKQKQYGTIERLKSQVATMTQQHNDDLLKIAGLEEKVNAAETKLTTASKGDSETVVTLRAELDAAKKAQKKAEDELKALKDNTVSREEVEKEIRAELEKEFEVRSYRMEQLAANQGKILVPELVMGDTKEAIDASIQSAIARSDEIRKSLGITTAQGGQQTTPPQTFQPFAGVQQSQGRTPRSPSSPSIDLMQDSGVSLERLATVDVGSPEYAQMRKQLGLK